jgi:polar amino acid transport system permease protein
MMDGIGVVWDHRGQVIAGFLHTVWLAGLGTLFALVFGALLAMAMMARRAAVARLAHVLVDAMRCVPFLLFVYLVYFGLPSAGLRLDSWTSGLLALVVYNAAYMAEILRGTWAALPRDSLEAGQIFGFTGLPFFRRIVLPQVVVIAAPVIGNQVIQIIKDTAFLMIVAVPELTQSVSSIQAAYYVPFSAFLVAAGLYWVLCAIVESAVGVVGRHPAAIR